MWELGTPPDVYILMFIHVACLSLEYLNLFSQSNITYVRASTHKTNNMPIGMVQYALFVKMKLWPNTKILMQKQSTKARKSNSQFHWILNNLYFVLLLEIKEKEARMTLQMLKMFCKMIWAVLGDVSSVAEVWLHRKTEQVSLCLSFCVNGRKKEAFTASMLPSQQQARFSFNLWKMPSQNSI